MHLLEALFMEEMEVNHVDDIHEKLTDMVGDRVKVKANMGRTRVVERMGIGCHWVNAENAFTADW